MKDKPMNFPTIAITSGEPAGIGIDICLAIPHMNLPCRPVVLGDFDLFAQRAHELGLDQTIKLVKFDPNRQPEPHELSICPIPLKTPCQTGQLNPQNSPYVIELLDRAMSGIQSGEFAAMVTAPIHKGVINDYLQSPEYSGSLTFFSGHTEYLAEQSHTPKVVMMLAGGGLRVALLTTHIPVREVADNITIELIEEITQILNHDLIHKFGIKQPKILLAGLNPHAGENGHLGREELDIMQPAAQKLRSLGIDISDPLPADTLFQPFMLKNVDAVLAAYHDQGLPVLKYASFGGGVNITLGLPFIRTSVDHGTALGLAGTGQADSGSLKAAIQTALEMIESQNPPK